jgi:cbb3-type cytochrome oxidase subunit 1
MPTPSRWLIRCSLLYLLIGFTMGAFMLIVKITPLHSWIGILLPIHIEILIFGWIIQLTMGTAYWIFPRFLETGSRGNRALAWGMIICLNAGIFSVIIGSLSYVQFPFRLLGRILETLSVILFIAFHWRRIVTYRNRE